MPTNPKNAAAGEDHIFLLNRVSLEDYLSFMASYPVGAQRLERRKLSAEWKAAHELMDRLRQSEPRWADETSIGPLPAEMQALVPNVLADPIFVKAYSDAPVEFGVVELDRLVVSQKIVCADHLTRLHKQLGANPTPSDLFRFCLPYEHSQPDHRASRIEDDAFAFVSESTDLRFLEAVILDPAQVSGYQAVGPVAGIVGLVVGFGSNYVNVVAVENRLVLNNGHHRACALRAMGITHAPCAIQRVTCAEELDVLAPSTVCRNPEFYLTEPRPPALKDYFDPRLSRHVRLAMNRREVRISFSVDETDIP